MEKIKTKDALIEAGIQEIRQFGLQNFSIRRVANACGVSCATPYKHYKNKNTFILAIFRHLHEKWQVIQQDIIKHCGSLKESLVNISVAYVHFLIDNPDYRAIIFSEGDENTTPEQQHEIAQLSVYTKGLINDYCDSVGMSKEVRIRKTFIVRSMIYSAAIMIENGELANSDDTYQMIRSAIEREFTLS